MDPMGTIHGDFCWWDLNWINFTLAMPFRCKQGSSLLFCMFLSCWDLIWFITPRQTPKSRLKGLKSGMINYLFLESRGDSCDTDYRIGLPPWKEHVRTFFQGSMLVFVRVHTLLGDGGMNIQYRSPFYEFLILVPDKDCSPQSPKNIFKK